MPRKSAAKNAVAKGEPTQGQVARLINDSFDMLSSEFISQLMKNDNVSEQVVREIRDTLVATTTDTKNRTIDQLLKYYKPH